MKTLRFRILFAGFLIVTALVSSGWIWPLSLIFGEPRKPDYHFRPKITVEGLEKKYGAPVYHRTYDAPVTDASLKFVKLAYDEEIAFEMGKQLVVYYFSKGKLVASALKNKGQAPESAEPETMEPAPSDEAEAPPAETQEEEPTTSNIMERF